MSQDELLDKQENHYFIVYKIYSDAEPKLNSESESCRFFTEEELKNELKEHPERFGEAFHFVVKNLFPDLVDQNDQNTDFLTDYIY